MKYLDKNNIDAYIPNFGQYVPHREGFIYNKEQDQYECQRGNKAILPCKGNEQIAKVTPRKHIEVVNRFVNIIHSESSAV
ncbi:MAG: hypothetical protein IPF62_12095 [Bacteroidetes bacterium]|nr:hypothetical protein [Bacteroidota bacterium]